MIYDAPPTRGPAVGIHPSAAIELGWVLAAAERADYHPVLAAMYDAAPELRDRARTFWGADVALSCGSFLELLVLAHHGGLLFSLDAAALLGRMDELAATAPTDSRLASEPDADRRAILARLEQLRSSSERRRQYVALLTDAWTAVSAIWQREGRPAVDAAIVARRELLAKDVPWPQVARADSDYDGLLPRLVDGLGPDDQLAVVPAYFTHRGLLVDLPGVLVVGVRTDESGAASRARTELLARRLKSLSDPTRLAILDSLSHGPASVTEIALAFGLAQPTVSNHVKLLREAGLIAKGPHGTGGSGRELVVQPDAIAGLLDQLQSLLQPHAATDQR
jgi:DNA-binding transcriptional ArsR family regulator